MGTNHVRDLSDVGLVEVWVHREGQNGPCVVGGYGKVRGFVAKMIVRIIEGKKFRIVDCGGYSGRLQSSSQRIAISATNYIQMEDMASVPPDLG